MIPTSDKARAPPPRHAATVALVRGLRQRGFSDLRDWDGNLLRYPQDRSATVMEVARLFGVTKQAASSKSHPSSNAGMAYESLPRATPGCGRWP
jgi:hypothetical protein